MSDEVLHVTDAAPGHDAPAGVPHTVATLAGKVPPATLVTTASGATVAAGKLPPQTPVLVPEAQLYGKDAAPVPPVTDTTPDPSALSQPSGREFKPTAKAGDLPPNTMCRTESGQVAAARRLPPDTPVCDPSGDRNQHGAMGAHSTEGANIGARPPQAGR